MTTLFLIGASTAGIVFCKMNKIPHVGFSLALGLTFFTNFIHYVESDSKTSSSRMTTYF